MRFALLTNNFASHNRPMAEGLKRMFDQVGVEAEVFYYGLRWLTFENPFYRWNRSVPHRLKTLTKKGLISSYLTNLKNFDAIVIVAHMPVAFMRHLQVELIRQRYPDKPIILYDLIYLPTLGKWAEYLKKGNPQCGIHEAGHFGLERYDWYLIASSSHEYPLTSGLRQPYSLIGLNLDDGTLFPEKKDEFIALIDFGREQTRAERAIQVQALEETKTNYVELRGHYPIKEIRKIYRKCSIYFVAWRESFGLPICELQACGSYIFTPYARWCPSHWIKEDLNVAGPGWLSPNFIIYNNDKDELKEKITSIKRSYDPKAVFNIFIQYHPQLYSGDLDELRNFVWMIESGSIHSNSHTNYLNWKIIDSL